MLSLDEKRIIDSIITKKFLENNKTIVNKLVVEFTKKLKENLNDESYKFYLNDESYKFYLKGGNAISLLKNETPTGDYDFQLSLSKNYYEDNSKLEMIDIAIINSLKKTLIELKPRTSFSSEIFETANLIETINLELKNKLELKDKKENILAVLKSAEKCDLSNFFMTIGAEYKNYSYSEILNHKDFKNNRLEIERNSIITNKFSNGYGATVYVNYTIPGFILYRMVCRCPYKISRDEEIYLKSEIIDISVPRKGSPEVYISQDGLVTHFIDLNITNEEILELNQLQCKLPNWGYHFYENINLLQEIKLGISGSEHKKEKRKARALEALEKLKEVNKNPSFLLLSENINETKSDAKILGFLGALTYNIEDNLPEKIKTYCKQSEKNHIETLTITSNKLNSKNEKDKNEGLIDFFVNYRIGYTDSYKAIKNGIQKSLNYCILNYNNNKGIVKPLSLEQKTYNLVTPYNNLNDDDKIWQRYIRIKISSEIYDDFYKFYNPNKKSPSRDIIEIDDNQFGYILHAECGAVVAIFQKSEDLDIENNTTNILEKSLFTWQRHSLGNILRKK